MLSFSQIFIDESVSILRRIEPLDVERLANGLSDVRMRGGRLFILGVGGSAGHASHAVNDFRKICGIETYSPTDNVSELTARINDEGWDTCFSEWLRVCRISAADGVLVFSVGGGSRTGNISMNIVRALETARATGASIYGIVGRDGGFTREIANACIVIPPVYQDRVTPHTEGICAVVWHLLVSHPSLKLMPTKWERTASTMAVKA
jgi:D-sedoheptulose 7-phosphate isomerase